MILKRMRVVGAVLCVALAVYSAVLIATEWSSSQQFVRNYLTDIEGPVPFYAVNTTLSVFLLWTTAVLFLVAAACTAGDARVRQWWWFFVSQACLFAFLGADDRFKFHEWSARMLGIADHFILLATGLVEVALLGLFGGKLFWKSRASLLFGAATVFFAVMFVIDAWVPHDMVLRLSLEDLAKTWSAALFCLYAWAVCLRCIERLKEVSLFGDSCPWPEARRC